MTERERYQDALIGIRDIAAREIDRLKRTDALQSRALSIIYEAANTALKAALKDRAEKLSGVRADLHNFRGTD